MVERSPGRCALALAVVGAIALGAVGCGSTYDKAVDEANRTGKPLIIEFYADWCIPCRKFERDVLTRADVQRALGDVVFRRFDYDSKSGRHHARRLGVRIVPMFLAVDREGTVVGGLRGAVSAERFLEFLSWTQLRAGTM